MDSNKIVMEYVKNAEKKTKADVAANYRVGNRIAKKLISLNEEIIHSEDAKSIIDQLLTYEDPSIFFWIVTPTLALSYKVDEVEKKLSDILADRSDRSYGSIRMNALMGIKKLRGELPPSRNVSDK